MGSFNQPDAKCPLDGLVVLDLTRLVAGNMLSLQLADFGAEVIKIEQPCKGDPLRDAVVPRLSASPGALRRPAPELGEHTAEVLARLGVDGAAQQDLSRRKII